uniref:Transmembrane protein 231 n=1 Tax=Neobodo designis TaxID=312471 RepID=A0A7S1R2F2_NEODS|eukprot:CAMPEP_0174856016 /NCGR_PEP_ID=MMETSP1114-20130205/34875_1 /TAXON_ID=312471 /ORGANISM="Neobodo designis, Strain CCAP 1951/1" /LENGTH=316 /DNA_ID=CAMNT_0016090791 /DNA_START=33 /DNA_END=983 /DNA_ORIENTATION=+
MSSLHLGVLLLLVLAAEWVNASCNCYGRGEVAFNGSHYCRCKCVVNRTQLDGSAVIVEEYVPPDCRYTTAQVERVRVDVQQPLAGFLWPKFATAVIQGLALDPVTATLFRHSMTNVSASSIRIDFDFRDNAVTAANSLGPAQQARARFEQAVADPASYPWVATLGISAVSRVTKRESVANSDPTIAATVGGYEIPWETMAATIALIMIPFSVFFTDMIASDNFISSEEEGQELLDEYIKATSVANLRMNGEGVELNVSPSAHKYAGGARAEKEAWLEGLPEDQTDEPVPLQRKATRSARDYSAHFYAAAQDGDESQ